MNFKPVQYNNRTTNRCPALRYATRQNNKSRTNKSFTLIFTSDLAKKAGLVSGTMVRLDADTKAGLARLIPVTKSDRCVVGTGRNGVSLRVQWPYNNDLSDLFPVTTEGPVPLQVDSAGKDNGIVFTLPGNQQ